MLSFATPWLALAGILAASGPVIIHLLNRQRFRTVAWGMMEFLQRALARQRRTLQLRDVLLMVLRMVAVLLAGLALARPQLSGGGFAPWGVSLLFLLCCGTAIGGAAAAVVARDASRRMVRWGVTLAASLGCLGLWSWSALGEDDKTAIGSHGRVPVHAVILMDNSRSMGALSGTGSRLEQAQRLVKPFLEELPSGSRVSVIPVAGTEQPFTLEAFATRQDAQRACDEIPLVDAADSAVAALELAERACQQVTSPEAKCIVAFTDLQSSTWSGVDWAEWGAKLPGLQIVPVGRGAVSNLSLDTLQLEDGFASANASQRLLARLRAEGIERPTLVELLLRVDGEVVSRQTQEVVSGQVREIEFEQQFDMAGEPGRPRWIEAMLEVQTAEPGADRLPSDNRRTLLIPVLDQVRVVFIDEYGDSESVAAGRVGETYALRHLLVPRMTGDSAAPQPIQAIHRRPDQLTTEDLSLARLVVVCGVSRPGKLVTLLHQYLMQGGAVLLGGGGEFDPVAWQQDAWNNGRGILPVPLAEEFVGELPTGDRVPTPFFIDYGSVTGSDFQVAGEDPGQLAALFEGTPFFRAIVARTDATTETEWLGGFEQSVQKDLELRAAADDEQHPQFALAVRRWQELDPSWWSWKPATPCYPPDMTAVDVVARERPEVLARLTTRQLPWLIERQVGRGRVVLMTSGVTSDWNLLRTSGALYVLHRLSSRLIASTVSARQSSTGERLAIPLADTQTSRWELTRPSGRKDTLMREGLPNGLSGVFLRRTVNGGFYRLRPINDQELAARGVEAAPTENVAVASAARDFVWSVQPPASESILTGPPLQEIQAKIGNAPIRLLEAGEAVRWDGTSRRHEQLWKWTLLGALLALTAEMAVLKSPSMGSRP